MQMTFPTERGYAGMFVVGTRKSGGRFERTGTVVLKRTYDVNPVSGVLAPAAEPIPVFPKDQPDNLVLNGDFEMSQAVANEDPKDPTKPARWVSVGLVALDLRIGFNSPTSAAVTGAGSLLRQPLTFETALGARQFTLSFAATVGPPFGNAQVQNVCLRAPDGTELCGVNPVLTNAMQRFSATAAWPAAVDAKEVQVILPSPTDPARTALYDRVQLEERGQLTIWDPETMLRYEHDLAPFKPETDLIVLGLTDLPAPSRVLVDGVRWLEAPLPASAPQKALFGWESRVAAGPRKDALGTLLANPPSALRPDFDNSFFNGYRRDAAQPGAQPFVVGSALAEIRVQRDTTPATADYVFRLRGDVAMAEYRYDGGTKPDDRASWQRQQVPMTVDTIVVEPDAHRCYVVWRGVWPFDDVAEEAYRELAVAASP